MKVYQISLVPGPIWQWSELPICSLFTAVFDFPLWNIFLDNWNSLRRKTGVLNLCSSRKNIGMLALQFLVFYVKLSVEISCHPLKFKLIFSHQNPSFSTHPMAGLCSKLSHTTSFFQLVHPAASIFWVLFHTHKHVVNIPFMVLKCLIPFQMAAENTSPLTLNSVLYYTCMLYVYVQYKDNICNW